MILWNNLDHASAAMFLHQHLPGEDHASLEPIGYGDFCLAFKSGNQVIRVARHLDAAAALRRESCTLKKIAAALPLTIPQLTYYSPQGFPPFTIHDEVIGEVLTREIWESQPARARKNLASDLAAFLRALHSLPIELGRSCDLMQLDANQLAQALREEIANTIHGRLEPEAQLQLEATLERWSLPSARYQHLALLHCDLGPGHVFYDPRSGHLTGVIDFGDIAIGDPARDFIYVYEDYGPLILREVLKRYAGKNAPKMMPEIRKWYLLEAISWTINRCAEKHEADIEHGLAEIRRELAGGFP